MMEFVIIYGTFGYDNRLL